MVTGLPPKSITEVFGSLSKIGPCYGALKRYVMGKGTDNMYTLLCRSGRTEVLGPP